MKKIVMAIATAAALCCGMASAQSATTTRYVLSSVAENRNLPAWSLDSRKLHDPADWSIRKYALHGGKQEGVDVVELRSGALKIVVVPTRGMSVRSVERGDVKLGWQSPVQETVNPAYMNLESRGGLGWLDGFNEWMVRAGIEWAGHPGMDNGRMLTLHGRIGNIPASEVEVIVERGAQTTLRIRGQVDEKSMFGAALELWTEVSTVVGTNRFTITDEIRNAGALPQEFQIIYHGNYGAPLLEEGARFVAPVKELRPIDGEAAKAMDEYATYRAPAPGFKEQVYGVQMWSDERHRTLVMLRNRAGDKAMTMGYSVDELPYLNLWKNTGAAEDAYVTGLEPATGYAANRSLERAGGRVPTLAPGETRRISLDFSLLDNTADVARAGTAIEAIRSGRGTTMNPETIKPAS
ncbi:aldose 1-epimerase family protein [Variovorax sp. ZS18.2.2]|uniref:aldose 1-epimerase family protein n=1 Tax=Variovorax sp. ZS18.2.2 TaxID=2971255 RepID=UPI002151BC4B|nr:aldose 1-epimerase family protein [Variovorax sp. ZS18.2.2]MCR6476918.1 aldose 1-epimerase family protein [Variovorax sp. ZS18.2.2]